MIESSRIVRAIDVGYGNTKFTLSDIDSKELKCGMFPSVAPVYSIADVDRFGDEKRTALIEINGITYQVGDDAILGMGSNAARTLDVEFPKRDAYLALARGAMLKMNVPHIDLLVVGLPVSNMDDMADLLKRRLTGEHVLPGKDPAGRPTPKTLQVREVKVLPQPFGGLLDYAVRNMLVRQLQAGNTLLIDPGYFTLDWIVSTGLKVAGFRSGAHPNAGMAAILRSVADRLATKIRTRTRRQVEVNEQILQRLDEAIRLGTSVRVGGQEEVVSDCMQGVASIVESGLTALRARVGSISDIDRVILVGGAAKLYETAVQDMFKGYDVVVASDSAYANVRGFQWYGEREAAKQPAAAQPARAA